MKTSVARKLKPVNNQEQAFNLDAVLSGAQKAETPASKSKVPVLDAPKEVKEKVDKIRKVKEQRDTAEAQFRTLEAELFDFAAPKRAEMCKRGYVSSVKIPGTNSQTITATWTSSFSKIPIDHKEAIQKFVGEDFNDYFEQKMEITVKADISEDDLKALVQAVGPQQFAKYFEVKRWLSPTGRYNEDQFSMAEDVKTGLSAYVKPFKPSLKV